MIDNTKMIPEIVNLLKEAQKSGLDEKKLAEIKKAALFAYVKHEGQFRKSGEPYIIHPIATASILLNWHMDVPTIITGILHDVLEDTHTTEAEIENYFGLEVANLLKYVTKISLLSKENRQNKIEKDEIVNNYTIQLFLSMSQDIRGMIVKLADRYHNMLTIKYLRPDKQVRIAKETLLIYANVAGRLGMYRLKNVLQDLSFQVIDPNSYNVTKDELEKIIKKNEPHWQEIINKLKSIFDLYNMSYEIKERQKGIYSTWEKKEKGYDINNIHDIYAIRIIVNDNLDCYKILGLIHLNFNFIKNAFKDYISSPKLNYYQSIHTTVTKNGTLLEIQIRTKQMDLVAESGVAAHWVYKEYNEFNMDKLKKSFNLINEVSNLQNKTFDNLIKLANDVVFDVLVLNDDTTRVANNQTRAIDMAYKVDPENFKFLQNIVINGQKMNLDTLLKPNDVLLFNYSNKIYMTKQWLKFTKFNVTIDAIKKVLTQKEIKQFKNEKEFFEYLRHELKGNYVGDDKVVTIITKKLKIGNMQHFLNLITNEVYSDKDFLLCFDKQKSVARQAWNKLKGRYGQLLKQVQDIYFNNIEGIYFTDLIFPNCCNKVPGIDVVAKIVKNNILEVHSANCHSIKKSGNIKIYPIAWDNDALKNKPRKFKYYLNFTADWMPSIGNTISKKMIMFNITISSLKINKNKIDGTCVVNIEMYVNDLKQVKSLIANLNQELNIKTNINFN